MSQYYSDIIWHYFSSYLYYLRTCELNETFVQEVTRKGVWVFEPFSTSSYFLYIWTFSLWIHLAVLMRVVWILVRVSILWWILIFQIFFSSLKQSWTFLEQSFPLMYKKNPIDSHSNHIFWIPSLCRLIFDFLNIFSCQDGQIHLNLQFFLVFPQMAPLCHVQPVWH